MIYFDVLNALAEVVFDIVLHFNENNKKIYKPQFYSPSALNVLIAHLNKKDFPIDSFDFHYPVVKHFAQYAKGMTPDLTIINPETMHPIAFFKSYDKIEDYTKDSIYDEAYHLNKYSDKLLLYPYYIFISDGVNGNFYELRALFLEGKKIDSSTKTCEPINYKALCNSDALRTYRTQFINKKKILKNGKFIFSLLIPILSIIWFVLDKLKIFEITELRLIVFGFIIISTLIPYITQFSIKHLSVAFKEKSE